LHLTDGFNDGKTLTSLPGNALSLSCLGSDGTRAFLSFASLLLRITGLRLQRTGNLLGLLGIPPRLLQPELRQAGLGG